MKYTVVFLKGDEVTKIERDTKDLPIIDISPEKWEPIGVEVTKAKDFRGNPLFSNKESEVI